MIANMCFGFLLETQGSYCCLWLSVSLNHSLLGVERDTGWLLYAWPVPELICQQLLCATVRRTRVYGSFHTVPLQLVLLPRSSNYLLHSSMCTPNKTVPASLLLCHHLSKYINEVHYSQGCHTGCLLLWAHSSSGHPPKTRPNLSFTLTSASLMWASHRGKWILIFCSLQSRPRRASILAHSSWIENKQPDLPCPCHTSSAGKKVKLALQQHLEGLSLDDLLSMHSSTCFLYRKGMFKKKYKE